jgi:voltage-gated potassium channel Kch
MKPVFGHLRRFWSTEWSLTAFLILLVVTVFIIFPVDNLFVTGSPLVSIFLSLLLISGMAAASERRAPTLIVTGLVVVTLFLRWLAHFDPLPDIIVISLFSALVCFGLLAGVVMVQVFRKGPITGHRIQGAIAVYLLLGLIWSLAYEITFYRIPGSFQPADLGVHHVSATSTLVYFSYVTLTTVGYGDITPAHPITRSLATLEALVGQLYPAILIGRLVALQLSSRQSKSSES